VKLFIESYFDLCFGVAINLLAFLELQTFQDLEPFFGTPLDITCSIFVITYALLLVLFPLYGFVAIYKNQGNLDKKEVYRSLEPFLEGVKLNYLHSSMYNVYFLLRRLFTGFGLVMLNAYPYFQCSFLMIFSIINFVYTAVERPFLDRKTYYIELLNEFSILLCSYIMNIFLQGTASDDFYFNVGWVFMGVAIANVLSNVVFLIVDQIFIGYWGVVKFQTEQEKIKIYNKRIENLKLIC